MLEKEILIIHSEKANYKSQRQLNIKKSRNIIPGFSINTNLIFKGVLFKACQTLLNRCYLRQRISLFLSLYIQHLFRCTGYKAFIR